MKIVEIEDSVLVRGCQNGERSAMEMLYYKFSAIVFSLLRRYLSSRDDAEDIRQETFIKVFTNIHNYTSVGSFEGWIKRIAINLAINHLNAQKRFRADFDSIDDLHIESVASQIKSSASVEANDLLAIINLLPAQKQTIFKLHDIDGFSNKEIADMLQITEAGVRSQLSKARTMLAELHTKINNYECQ